MSPALRTYYHECNLWGQAFRPAARASARRLVYENSGICLLLIAHACFAQQYVISTVAGGAPQPTPIAAVNAAVDTLSVAVDSTGSVYFTTDNCVFKIAIDGTLTRVAGNSRRGSSGDGGSATSAQLNRPSDVAIDASGNIYITEEFRIRKVSANGIISTIAGDGKDGFGGVDGPAVGAKISPSGLATDAAGNLYFADTLNSRVRKITPAGVMTTVAGNGTPGIAGDGGPATSANLSYPSRLAVDASGNVYVVDNSRIRKVSTSGMIATIAGGGNATGDGGQATAARLSPASVTVDAAGNVFFAEVGRVRKVSTAGILSTVAGTGTQGYSGDGGPATSAQLQASGVSVDASGNLYFADVFRLRKVSASGTITTVAGTGTAGSFSGDSGPALDARIDLPKSVAVDASGNVYFADTGNQRIRKISTAGIITTVAGGGTVLGDGGPATSARLMLSDGGLALDAIGNLYIADWGNHRIRKVSPGGIITTVAGNGTAGYSGDGLLAVNAQLNQPDDVAVDAAGNLYIADYLNTRVRKVSSVGIITTLAGNGQHGSAGDGGPATNAQLFSPTGVAVDATGNVYIVEPDASRIRKVSPDGIITTAAGTGTDGFSGDGGPARSARFANMIDASVDGAATCTSLIPTISAFAGFQPPAWSPPSPATAIRAIQAKAGRP